VKNLAPGNVQSAALGPIRLTPQAKLSRRLTPDSRPSESLPLPSALDIDNVASSLDNPFSFLLFLFLRRLCHLDFASHVGRLQGFERFLSSFPGLLLGISLLAILLLELLQRYPFFDHRPLQHISLLKSDSALTSASSA
jgi:hypothetical protein